MVHCDIAVILGPRGQTEKGGLFWVPLVEGGHRYILLKAQTGIKQGKPHRKRLYTLRLTSLPAHLSSAKVME